MTQERTYSADEVATAARELREAAGAGEESFPKERVIAMLGDEIRLLRERGFTDDQIAAMCRGFDIQVTTADIAADSPRGGGFN
jgi:hypothetical protein